MDRVWNEAKTIIPLKNIGSSTCTNRLYVLEGAIHGIRWHNLSEKVGSELKSSITRINKGLDIFFLVGGWKGL
jgi:hypothetical protein